jgi:Bacteriophage related domain of unknown function
MSSPAVYAALRTFLNASYAATPLLYENEYTDAPSTAWALVEMSATQYFQTSIGAQTQAANRWDEEGSFFIHVMVPAGSGVTDAFAYSYALADLFRGLTLLNGNVEFNDVIVGAGSGSDDEGNWYRVSVNVGWRMIDSRN